MSSRLKLPASLLAVGAIMLPGTADAKDLSYRGGVDVRPASRFGTAVCERRVSDGEPCTLHGVVFLDRNRDGKRQRTERGVQGVAVSNGRDVVMTDRRGRYRLPIYEQPGGTTVFISKPAGYEVPLDAQNMPQFFYHHLPEGSPSLRFGGLAPTGPLPRAVHFPLVESKVKDKFSIVVSGDTQPYSNNEIGYVRDSLAKELASMGEGDVEILTEQSTHLWTVDLPADLPTGAHTAKVTTVVKYGNEYASVIASEVADERPAPYFQSELFE